MGATLERDDEKKQGQEEQQERQQDERAREMLAGYSSSSSQQARGTIFSPGAMRDSADINPLTPTTDSMRVGAAQKSFQKSFVAELESDLEKWTSEINDVNSVSSKVLESTTYLIKKYSTAEADLPSLQADQEYHRNLKQMIEKAANLDSMREIEQAESYDDRIDTFVRAFMTAEGSQAENFLVTHRANVASLAKTGSSNMKSSVSMSDNRRVRIVDVDRNEMDSNSLLPKTTRRFWNNNRRVIAARVIGNALGLAVLIAAATYAWHEWYIHDPALRREPSTKAKKADKLSQQMNS